MRQRKIILFELNEVPFRVLDDFCRRHPQSTCARRIHEFVQYETTTDDSVLSPWITWPTVHRGVNDSKHHIRFFGQDLSAADRAYPPIWRILAAEGLAPGVFASLHSYPVPGDLDRYAFYVPDPFAAEPVCAPEELRIFQEFNLAMSRGSMRNVSGSVPLDWCLRLARKIPSLGVRGKTIADVARQIIDERVSSWKRVRRRTYQTILSFDVFMRQLAQKKPRFATFFTNHVASSMHRYWAATYPTDFEKQGFGAEWIERYRGEIDFTMRKFDAELERLLRFVDDTAEYELWIASSMGQAANDNRQNEPVKSQVFVESLDRFMAALGIHGGQWSERPAMAPEVCVYVEADHLDRFRTAIGGARINGQPVRTEERERGFFCMAFGESNLGPDAEFLELQGKRLPFAGVGLRNVSIEDESGSSGYHVPAGALLIYDPRGRRGDGARRHLQTTEIAPTLLARLGVTPPGYMRAPIESLS